MRFSVGTWHPSGFAVRGGWDSRPPHPAGRGGGAQMNVTVGTGRAARPEPAVTFSSGAVEGVRRRKDSPRSMEVSVDVVVKGHHCEGSDRFRQYVEQNLERIEKIDQRVLRCEVEVCQEKNPRQQDRAFRVELTMYTRGPGVRGEAT